MKAQEIRFGNIFNFEDDSLCMSCYGVVISIKEWHGRWKSITNANLGYEQDDNYIDFEPIELTPEILEKCGFDRYTEVPNDGIGDKLEVFEGLYGVVFFFDVHGALVFKDYHSNMNRPKYLHQLQNLYFALTGEELEVKL